MSNPRLRFKGEEYILINGRDNRTEGAIATVEQFESFADSYAHLFENGEIVRYGEVIGTIEDIEWLDE